MKKKKKGHRPNGRRPFSILWLQYSKRSLKVNTLSTDNKFAKIKWIYEQKRSKKEYTEIN